MAALGTVRADPAVAHIRPLSDRQLLEQWSGSELYKPIIQLANPLLLLKTSGNRYDPGVGKVVASAFMRKHSTFVER